MDAAIAVGLPGRRHGRGASEAGLYGCVARLVSIPMVALIITIFAGGAVGWLCHGRFRRSVALTVLVSAVCFGVAWCSKRESPEVLIQWMQSQLGSQVLAYSLGFLLPCAAGATVTYVWYRNPNRK
jgi:hypothetical protein